MRRHLPIFPLNTVLFPGATLPLQIFEPRYKQMLKVCMDGDRRFGVMLIKTGDEVGGPSEPYEVGTVARIVRLDEPVRGVLPFLAIGEQRFRLLSVNRSLPYLTGEVELLDDACGDDAAALVPAVREAADRYVATLLAAHGTWHADLGLPDDPTELSYLIGIVLQAPPPRLQRLLEIDSVPDRLAAAAQEATAETERLKASMMRSGPGREESRFSLN